VSEGEDIKASSRGCGDLVSGQPLKEELRQQAGAFSVPVVVIACVAMHEIHDFIRITIIFNRYFKINGI